MGTKFVIKHTERRFALVYLKDVVFTLQCTGIFPPPPNLFRSQDPKPAQDANHAPNRRPTGPAVAIAVRRPSSTATRSSATPASPCSPCGWCSASLDETGAASDEGVVAVPGGEGGGTIGEFRDQVGENSLEVVGSLSMSRGTTRCVQWLRGQGYSCTVHHNLRFSCP